MKMENIESRCFICGNEQCQEEADHKKITFSQFDALLKQKAGYHPQIEKIKNKIRKCFHQIEKQTNSSMTAYINDLFLLVDKLHFWHLLQVFSSLRNIEAVIYGWMLPRNQMIALLHGLNQKPDHQMVFPKFELLLYEVHRFKKLVKKVGEKRDYGELFSTFTYIIQKCEDQFNGECLAKRNQRVVDISEEGVSKVEVEEAGSEFVLINGNPFSVMRKSIDLSDLRINNNFVVEYLSAFSKMKNLSDLQIRNNTLTKLGYTMLFNTLPQLQSLDVSYSNSQALAELVLGAKLPNIKTLYLNETGLSDEGLMKIVGKMENLRAVFADLNGISNEGVLELFKMRKNLIYASMKGNRISIDCASGIQVSLIYKGGYLQY